MISIYVNSRQTEDAPTFRHTHTHNHSQLEKLQPKRKAKINQNYKNTKPVTKHTVKKKQRKSQKKKQPKRNFKMKENQLRNCKTALNVSDPQNPQNAYYLQQRNKMSNYYTYAEQQIKHSTTRIFKRQPKKARDIGT